MIFQPRICVRLVSLGFLSLLLLTGATASHAGKTVAEKPAAKPAATAPHAHPTSGASAIGSMGSAMTGFTSGSGVDLPQYVEPAAYSVSLVIHPPEGDDIVMKRFVDDGKIRTDINVQSQDISMIELGDEKGTSYTVMPAQKMAIKQSREAMAEMTKGMQKQIEAKQEKETAAAPDLNVKVEDLGDETVGGHAAKKLRISSSQGTAFGWFDKATGAPVKMESTVEGKTSSIEWRDMKVGPQPAKLYEMPKGYQVTDMDEMMAQMKKMGGASGMPGMGGLAGMGGMAGMGGLAGMGGMPGMGGGLRGMAGGMGQNFGAQMGSQLGTTLGASLGGPLGAMAGNYIGGKIGGMIGRKAVNAVMPGK